MDHFILFGDSITQQAFDRTHGFFGPALTDAYIRKLDIVNRGLSGYNVKQALEILPRFMPSPSQTKVRFMTIFFGANDARLPNTPPGPEQHVPLDQYRKNLKAIATHPCVRAHEEIRVILITPPPVDERKSIAADQEKYGTSTPRRTATTTARYAKAVRELGKELDLPVLDIWTAMIIRAGGHFSDSSLKDGSQPTGSRDAPISTFLQECLRDGLHLSRAGYEVLYEELMKLITQIWPDQTPERLPFVFAAWDDEQAWKGRKDVASL